MFAMTKEIYGRSKPINVKTTSYLVKIDNKIIYDTKKAQEHLQKYPNKEFSIVNKNNTNLIKTILTYLWINIYKEDGLVVKYIPPNQTNLGYFTLIDNNINMIKKSQELEYLLSDNFCRV